MADLKSSFPKNLAFNLKKLDAGFTKTKYKVLCDRISASSGDILRFRIPANGIYDFRSLCFYFQGSTAGTTVPASYIHFPRYSSSVIQNLSVTCGSTTLSSINEYSYLYSKLMDIEGADYSQLSKRQTAGELYDPSVKWTVGAAPENAITCARMASTTEVTVNDTNVQMCINNWLGILGSLSTTCVDLSDLGDIYINISLNPASILWKSNLANIPWTSDPSVSGANYTLTNMYMTIDRISFQSPDYYRLVSEKLTTDGLTLGYYDYYLVTSPLTAKSSGISMNFNVNSASLDQLIACYRREDYNQIKTLLLYGANTSNAATVKTFQEVLANPVGFSGQATDAAQIIFSAGMGDAFNNSVAFASAGNDLTSSSWSVNSIQVNPYAQGPIELFNNALQYTGFQNLDLGTSSTHSGMLSLNHFLKYYFVDICSLENVSGSADFWVSGIDARIGGANIQYNATFSTTNTQKVYCYIYCRSTKVLYYREGRQLEIDKPPKVIE